LIVFTHEYTELKNVGQPRVVELLVARKREISDEEVLDIESVLR